MSWLRPFGRPPSRNCPHCGRGLSTGLIPVRLTKTKPKQIEVSYGFRFCETCRMVWTKATKGTDYVMFKDGGKWRAKPR